MKVAIITIALLGSTTIFQSDAQCLVGDIMHIEGDSIGHIGLECINATSFDGSESTCGPNGDTIDTEMQFTCPESVPYCVQCGPRGFGAALCLSSPTTDGACGGGGGGDDEPEPTEKCCDPEKGPGGCPDTNGSFDNCWDEGGFCCSDGNWYADPGDGSGNCKDIQLGDSQACATADVVVVLTTKPTPPSAEVIVTADACEVGGACFEEGSTCTDGTTETCCGKTFDSFRCECYDGKYMCLNTDACMYPRCDTDSPTGAPPKPDEGDVTPAPSPGNTPVLGVETPAPTPGNTPVLGGYDEYGCGLSTGFTWCPELDECIAPWDTVCPLEGTDFEGPVTISCAGGRCSLPDDCSIDMGGWSVGGRYMNDMDGEYPIPGGCTVTCDGCAVLSATETQPTIEDAGLSTTQPTKASDSSTTQTTATEASGSSTTQTTEASSSNTTQPTEAADLSTTQPTEEPDPQLLRGSSGSISDLKLSSLCTCLFLAFALGFV